MNMQKRKPLSKWYIWGLGASSTFVQYNMYMVAVEYFVTLSQPIYTLSTAVRSPSHSLCVSTLGLSHCIRSSRLLSSRRQPLRHLPELSNMHKIVTCIWANVGAIASHTYVRPIVLYPTNKSRDTRFYQFLVCLSHYAYFRCCPFRSSEY